MKILALDIGDVTTGIAVADSSGLFVSTRPDIKTNDLQTFLLDFATKDPIKCIVYGLPLNSLGQEAFQCAKVRTIACSLEQALKEKGFSIEFVGLDERRSSMSARGVQASTKGKSKGSEHSIAAALLLEMYIQRQQFDQENSE